MKKVTVSIITMFTSLALMSPLYAAPPVEMHQGRTYYQQPELGTAPEEAQLGAQSQLQSESHTAEEILGMPVVSQDGETLGEIQNITIDTGTGRINYVTVRQAGAMGAGAEEGVAVPLEAFEFTDENARLMVDKNTLDNAPKRSVISDREFQRQLESHYGVSPAWRD